MVSREDNELLTRVGPGTPMGGMLRRYWLPACLSSEVAEADGDPVRVRLLGESLVAYRDTLGGVGLMEEACPHRGASLFFGRNEEGGLRCLYHGWKMDRDGRVLDMPCEPADSTFKDRLKHIAYPTHEQGGVVWAYMGPAEKRPKFPDYEWTRVPETHRAIAKIREEANWLQAVEGGIDTTHSTILHNPYPIGHPARGDIATQPTLEIEHTPYGFRYASIGRRALTDPTQKYVRVTLFAFPFHCFVPPKGYGSMHIFVPDDDEHTTFFGVNFSHTDPLDAADMHERRGSVMGVDLNPDFTKVRNRSNNYLQDRAAMRRESATGIRGIPNQDMCMQETMGAITNRDREHLGSADAAIVRMRLLMLQAVHKHMAGGDPPGLDPDFPYDRMRSDERVVPAETPWQAVGAFAGEYAEPVAF